VSLPLSPFGVSISQFILIGNWIAEKNFRNKFAHLKHNYGLLLFLSIMLLHLLGMLHTTNIAFGFHDMKLKLPLLIIPFVVGTSKRMGWKPLKLLLILFNWAVFIATLISMGVYFGMGNVVVDNIRDISIFISHERFALYIILSIYFLLYFLFFEDESKSRKTLHIFLILWFISFLAILKSLTGLVILSIASVPFVIYILRSKKRPVLLTVFVVIFTSTLVYLSVISVQIYREFVSVPPVNTDTLDVYTQQGNPYQHNLDLGQVENGNYVGLYISWGELKQEWNEVSDHDFDGHDEKGQQIKYTIIRYMTAKGLRKDSVGISKLTREDIKNIEAGMPNPIFDNALSFTPRIYQTIWEIDLYRKGKVPVHHSTTQRLEYIKNSLAVIRDHFWIGIGTGDLEDVVEEYFENRNTGMPKELYRRAHNQFITIWVTHGIIGFIWFVLAVFLPVWFLRRYMNYFFGMFFVVAILSFMGEDTLVTQSGATFFAYFYGLFLFGIRKQHKWKI
jgi:O-antigen ligase